MPTPIPLSILDLAPVPEGDGAGQALRRTVELARLGERLGFARHWFAEHHGMPSVASAAPEILIAHVAAATHSIRLGSGGIMLPNHSSLKVAETFKTLEALYPGRIDLGLGRAPGSDRAASSALRAIDGHHFPSQLGDLLAFSNIQPFAAGHPHRAIKVTPGDVPLPPIWLLGSSGASAEMAGTAGMGYSFASHFSPTPASPSLQAYRRAFSPSRQFPKPHAILVIAVVCAETAEEANRLASTMDLAWLRIRRGEFLPLPSPETALAYPYSEIERAAVADYRERTVVGTPNQVRVQLRELAEDAGADEVMVVSNLHDPIARLHSYELIGSQI